MESMCRSGRSDSVQILLASADLTLSQSRKQVIETNPGWSVTITRNKQHALALLHNSFFEVLILCSSLSPKVHLEFSTIFRRRNPDGRIVVTEERAVVIQPDAVLVPPVSPLELLACLRMLIRAGSA